MNIRTTLNGYDSVTGHKVRIGTYDTGVPHDLAEVSAVIDELAAGGLDAVSGFTPTKRAARILSMGRSIEHISPGGMDEDEFVARVRRLTQEDK